MVEFRVIEIYRQEPATSVIPFEVKTDFSETSIRTKTTAAMSSILTSAATTHGCMSSRTLISEDSIKFQVEYHKHFKNYQHKENYGG